MGSVEWTIFMIIVALCLFYIQKRASEVRYVVAFDNKSYLVQNKQGSQQAADMLARLNQKIVKMLAHLDEKYPEKDKVRKLIRKYNGDNLSEGSGDDDYTAYSVNKGEQIVFCLRSKKTGDFVDENVLVYVAVHELAHIYSTDIGHTKNFWRNFKFLLQESVAAKVYTPVDFKNKPVEYCGVEIKSSIL